MNWLLVAIILLLAHKQYLASPTPWKLPGYTQRLTPYIKHWEAANFDRAHLNEAHQKHIEQKRHRRKRALSAVEYGPAHTIKLKFFAHDREFRLVLRQNPLSVFASDVEIENSLGPVDYDISRIYTGSLEDDENSHVHAVLTSENLLDGTIETSTEHYYIEPAHRYSRDLSDSGTHSIIYKVSDVHMQRLGGSSSSPATTSASSSDATASTATSTSSASSNAEHCASERLRRSMLLDDLKRRKAEAGVEKRQKRLPNSATNDGGMEEEEEKRAVLAATSDTATGRNESGESDRNDESDRSVNSDYSDRGDRSIRRKRWLPDELSTPSSEDHQNPPLPLDLDVPYNDDFSIYTRTEAKTNSPFTRTTTTTATAKATTTAATTTKASRERNLQKGSVITWRNAGSNSGSNSVTYSSSSNEADFIPTPKSTATSAATNTTTRYTRNRSVIANVYNPNAGTAATTTTTTTTTKTTLKTTSDDDFFGNNYSYKNNNNDNNYNNNNIRKTYTKHKNIIISNYNRSSSNTFTNNNNNTNNSYNDNNNNNNDNFINNFFNTNWTTMFNANDRPIHKTHVEIITKNGATKKPNIIVNNYNPPEITLTPTNNNNNNQHHPNFNSMLMTNVLSGMGQEGGDSASHSAGNAARALYDRKITCMLYLQADHTFFQKMGSDDASIEAITRHVQRANTIYKNTDFNNDGKPDNITFMIKRIKVHNANALKDPTYRFPGSYGVEKFLELFSEEDYDAFCLAYMFTYRDFEMGTLGLAWTGDLKNAGGVCEKNGHYRGSLKSLNTGIVTLLNYGKHVPPAVSHVTLAHEIGHNFGSPHDPEQCTPGGEDGNFIMFARATSGDKKNNNKFSPCSLKSIEPVLNAKARSLKGCFTEPQRSICGNGVVEPGEQCDCGWEEDCKDACCFPMSRHPRIGEKPCTLTQQARCSPSQGPCCTTDCKVKFGDKCRDDNGCRDPSFCDGRMPQCPPSINKPNKTICNKEFVCYMGDCTGSICLAYGLESCQCIPGPNEDKIKLCELCCKQPGENNPCRSSFEWNEPPFDVPDMFAKPGTPCNDYNGYCDVFQKCREVDPNGPLATLRKLLLSEESIANFKKWIQTNWYTVALAALGVLILLIISIKLLSKRSNLKLKSVTIIHSATTETVRLPDDNNGIIVHTAVRTKVPFKKKVRGERSAKSKPPPAASSSNNSANKKKSAKMATKSALAARAKMPSSLSATEQQLKKSARTKKNRISVPPPVQQTATKASAEAAAAAVASIDKVDPKNNIGNYDSKKLKAKFKKQHSNKEIIDYSTRNAQAAAANAHTNTFGKVQKWLLESPIVAQPLSHIEHSSKVRKVMSKSQSTPERLVQKSPQKTKSTGSLAPNDKVKLQVVYKPPFKFALRLSKNAKVKTHVIGPGGGSGGGVGVGAVSKMKRKSRNGPGNESKRFANLEGGNDNSSGAERTKRTALLLRASSKNDEDNQVLTLNEPNYETLNPKTTSKLENPFYENLQYTQVSEARSASGSDGVGKGGSSSAGSGPRMSRSSSRTNLEAAAQPQHRSQRNYNRSHSLTTGGAAGNPFAVAGGCRNARKLSDSNSINLSRNFGSTQNLISASQSNLAKSKKRSSLNLKSSMSKNGKDPPPSTKRSNSNMNLRRDSLVANQINMSAEALQQPPLKRSLSSSVQQQQEPREQHAQQQQQQHHQQQHHQQQLPPAAPQQQKLPTHAAQRSARSSFNNIPRASLNVAAVAAAANAASANNTNATSNNSPALHSSNLSKFNFSRQSMPTTATTTSVDNANITADTAPTSHLANPVGIASNSHEQQRSRSNMMTAKTSALQKHSQQQNQQQPQPRSNSIRQLQHHNHHPPPLPPSAEQEMQAAAERVQDADMEVTLSDMENLVSS